MHRLLISRGVIEPLALDDDEVRQWLDCELASLIEGHFHQTVGPSSLDVAQRRNGECRVTGDRGLRDPRRDEFRAVYWLRNEAKRFGTLGIASTDFGGTHIGLSSLYVLPDLLRHPAGLNLGDCMVYAVAKLADAPLPNVGDDLAKTDLASALG
jgi:hypothetical protein